MRLYGRRCTRVLDELRGPEGDIRFTISCPGGAVQHLHVVDRYKHLGSIFTSDGQDATADARRKSSAAMAAYAKLVPVIFSSPHFGVQLKLQCLATFVLSRGVFNGHLWVADPRTLSIANKVYERIFGASPGLCGTGPTHMFEDLRYDQPSELHPSTLSC